MSTDRAVITASDSPIVSCPTWRERGPAGFSLIEVIVALGLLAGVLISVAGLMTVGQRQVASGRRSTEALAVARHALEELDSVGFHQIYGLFGHDGSAAVWVIDSRTNLDAAPWQALLDEAFADGHLEVRLESIRSSGTPPRLRDARAIRVEVRVFWQERLRSRQVELTTVRL